MTDIRIVIGANFGDEGKGLMTDYYAAEAIGQKRTAIVVLSNGGAQRGHTVVTPEGKRHVFHHFGSGTYAGADSYYPEKYIINPMVFMKEYEELWGNGQKTDRKIKIYANPGCMVTTPFEMITNQMIEQSRQDARHGSCGIGIWETIVRDGCRLGELLVMNDEQLRNYLEECRSFQKKRLAKKGITQIDDNWQSIIDDPELIGHYISDFKEMSRLIRLSEDGVIMNYDRIIFENGQGLLLDEDRTEFGVHTTPSHTGLKNPAELLKNVFGEVDPGKQEKNGKRMIDTEVCYVTRTYMTRHGAGQFAAECPKEQINPDMTDLTNVPNPYQGTIRYGHLDLEELQDRIQKDFAKETLPEICAGHIAIALTHINEYRTKEQTAAYVSDGEDRNSVKKLLAE